MSVVAFRRLASISQQSIRETIADIIGQLQLTDELLGETCLLKINAMSDELFPGRNTSPWVLDGVLSVLAEMFPGTGLIIVDSDVAGSRQFARACRNWGYNAIAEEHGVPIRNLAKEPTVAITTSNPVIPEMDLPELVTQADSIINLPVLKTHVLPGAGITCALKNHWGMLPRVRYQHHPHLVEVIAEINRQISHTVCTLVDGTICIEGSGPKTGTPRVANVLFGGTDRVAVDAAAMAFIGMDPAIAPHVKRAEEYGVGSMDFEIQGDEFVPEAFAMPDQSKDIVSMIESRLRRIPVLGPILYRPSIARVLGLIGTQYNKLIWMNLQGRKHVRAILDNPDYGPQFQSLERG